jgi:hypothetical protein
MNFFDLNDDVKSIIIKQFSCDYFISTIFISTIFMSKHQDLQKILFGEIAFDKYFCKIKKMMYYILVLHVLRSKNVF